MVMAFTRSVSGAPHALWNRRVDIFACLPHRLLLDRCIHLCQNDIIGRLAVMCNDGRSLLQQQALPLDEELAPFLVLKARRCYNDCTFDGASIFLQQRQSLVYVCSKLWASASRCNSVTRQRLEMCVKPRLRPHSANSLCNDGRPLSRTEGVLRLRAAKPRKSGKKACGC